MPTPMLSLSCRYVAAYVVRVGAKPIRVAPDPSRLGSRLEPPCLPPASQMAQGKPHGAVDPTKVFLLAYHVALMMKLGCAMIRSGPHCNPPPHPPKSQAEARDRSPYRWRDSRLALFLKVVTSLPLEPHSQRLTQRNSTQIKDCPFASPAQAVNVAV